MLKILSFKSLVEEGNIIKYTHVTQDKSIFAGHINVKAVQTFSIFTDNQWTQYR